MTTTADEKSTMETFWSDKPPIEECLEHWKTELRNRYQWPEIDAEIIEKTIQFLENWRDQEEAKKSISQKLPGA